MSHQIIKQPDGLLCVWSTVVDDFIVTDATAQELVDSYVRMAGDEARRHTARIINAVLADDAKKIYHQFAMTYEEAEALRRWRASGSPDD